MQSTGVFSGLNQGLTGPRRPMAPQSNSSQTLRGIQASAKPQTIAPPKRRRQLSAAPPKVGMNPFAQLHGVLAKALKGQAY